MLNIPKGEKRYTEIELDLHKKLAYEKGRASIVEELEEIKAEISELLESSVWQYDVRKIINKHISELKGE